MDISDCQDTHITAYLEYRSANSSPRTVYRLAAELSNWRSWIASRGGVLAATQLNAEQYIAKLTVAPMSKWNIIYTLRGLYKWMKRHKYIEDNPWLEVYGPRKPLRQVRVLTPQEICLVGSTFDHDSVRGQRDQAFFLFLRDTGCRISEAMGVNTADIHLCQAEDETGEAVVLGKNDKERTVFFGWETSQSIETWLTTGRPHWIKSRSGPVFLGYHGAKLSRSTAHQIIVRLEHQAGLARHIHAHLLRHTFATSMLQGGCNLYALKQLLGHASLKSTEIYLHLVTDDLKESYRHASNHHEYHAE